MSGDLIYTQQVLLSRAARWTAASVRPKTTTVHFGQVENTDEQRNVDAAFESCLMKFPQMGLSPYSGGSEKVSLVRSK